MKSSERDAINLELIAEAARKISLFLKDYTSEKFFADSKTQSAVIMQLIVIGEVSKKLSDGVKQNIDLPWKLMAGFRDLAVHEYFALDLKQVWETATNDIPKVAKTIAEAPTEK